eukprot:COSAG01_NODE_2002_length_8672_cov_53.309227_11_plen_35_part_01
MSSDLRYRQAAGAGVRNGHSFHRCRHRQYLMDDLG